MDVDGDKLARIAVGFEREGRVRHRFREINLAKDISGLAGISCSVPGYAFFERCHDTHPPACPVDATRGTSSVKQASSTFLAKA
jgi:hypothetical protein